MAFYVFGEYIRQLQLTIKGAVSLLAVAEGTLWHNYYPPDDEIASKIGTVEAAWWNSGA